MTETEEQGEAEEREPHAEQLCGESFGGLGLWHFCWLSQSPFLS